MPRNYKDEYRRRIRSGLARGLSLSQSRGHPKANERPVESRPARADENIDAAILGMNQGQSLSAAARSSHVSAERSRRFITQAELGALKGHRWALTDRRPRRVPVLTGGRQRTVIVDGFDQASLVGEHHNAVGLFVRTNDIGILEPFEGKSVRAVSGKQYLLETDPNELHRIAAMDTPPFHEIYQITSNT